MKQGWKTYLLYSSVVLLAGGFIYIIVETVNRKNTGFETKTLWDWMELLIIPAVLAGGAILLNRSERNTEREIATDRQQEAALQTYFDRMSELLLKEKLRTTENLEVRDVARTRTISIIRGLDTKRNNLILQFLSEAKLITDEKSILKRANMSGMNLQGAYLQGAYLQDANLQGVNLQGADLWGTNLQGANLQDANLKGANLEKAFLLRANLVDADLQGANLHSVNLEQALLFLANLQGVDLQDAGLQGADLEGAKLQGARLEGADLEGANLTSANLKGANLLEAQLADVKSLKGATMPDGTKHE